MIDGTVYVNVIKSLLLVERPKVYQIKRRPRLDNVTAKSVCVCVQHRSFVRLREWIQLHTDGGAKRQSTNMKSLLCTLHDDFKTRWVCQSEDTDAVANCVRNVRVF